MVDVGYNRLTNTFERTTVHICLKHIYLHELLGKLLGFVTINHATKFTAESNITNRKSSTIPLTISVLIRK